MTECYSCFAQGVELVKFSTDSPLSRALEGLGSLAPSYCVPCLTCIVCGEQVRPHGGAPASKEHLKLGAIHRVCLSSKVPAADEFYQRLRLILMTAGDQ
jgi:hypothetical protein